MKKVVLILAVAFTAITFSLPLQAQPSDPQNKERAARKERPSKEEVAEKFAKELGLSEGQTKELAKINEEFATETKQAREAMKAAQEERLESIVKLLDDEQMVKYLEMQKNRKGKGKMAQNKRGGKMRKEQKNEDVK